MLTSCNGELNIEFCDSLTNLSGLENINSMGTLSIVLCGKIIDLTGLQGLTSINYGSLFIYANVSLTTLSGLNNLSTVEKGIEITDNYALININGLESLSSIEGIIINTNLSLFNLQGLENLTTVDQDFELFGNNALYDLSGLGNLTTIGGMFSINDNGGLTSLSGLNNFDSAAHLYITGNTSLATCNIGNICDFLNNPTGSVNIYDNATGCNSPTEIADACGITMSCLPYGNYYFFSQNDIDNFTNNYPNCTDIMGSVKISGQDINNLAGLSMFNSVSSDLFIRLNPSLHNLSGFESLNSIGRHLIIEWNGSLSNITALNNLTFIGNDLQIWGNNLSDLVGLNNLSHIGNQLFIIGTEVTSLLPLSNLNYLGGTLRLTGNDYLTDLSGLENISSIEGDLVLYGNDSIINLTGLNNVTSIEADLAIGVIPWGGNTSLRSLTGLDNLIYVGGGLVIYDNNSLESLIALNSLTYVDEYILISENEKLESLEGIGNINTDSLVDLSIFNNPALSYCEVQSICDYLSIPIGSIYIHDNAIGCDTQTEVEFACSVLVSDINMIPEIEIYPNPAKTNISISNKNDVVINELIIYNQLGQKLLQKTYIPNKIDISMLRQGLYIIEIVADKKIVRKKLIIK